VVFFGDGFGLAVRAFAREAACGERLGVGLAVALGVGLALALGDRVGDAGGVLLATVVGEISMATGRESSVPEVRRTAPTVPPTATATPTAAVAAMAAGEEILRVRECLPTTSPVLSCAESSRVGP
jgi:hypothetical protein